MKPQVLALGAWLKNQACMTDGGQVHWSALHGDLRDVAACNALEQSARALVAQHGRPALIAHDLHPDFYSTRLALDLAQEWGIPTLAVQHHHAHIAGVIAEHRLQGPVIGLALDGVGLGTDGTAWGGELLVVDRQHFVRMGHLWPLALPGGDAAARQPWRMLASSLHAMGRSNDIVPLLGPQVGQADARVIQTMLQRGLQCPSTTSAGRWFDAASAALGIAPREQSEAEAAVLLETAAMQYVEAANDPLTDSVLRGAGVLDLRPLIAQLLTRSASGQPVSQAAAWFHRALAHALCAWAGHAAQVVGSQMVCLSGGCFFNKLLSRDVEYGLAQQGLQVWRPAAHSCGDNGIALGQAWVGLQQLSAGGAAAMENSECV